MLSPIASASGQPCTEVTSDQSFPGWGNRRSVIARITGPISRSTQRRTSVRLAFRFAAIALAASFAGSSAIPAGTLVQDPRDDMLPDSYFERFDTPKYRNKNPIQRHLI